MINAYEGGFAAMDKSLPISEMLKVLTSACEVPSTCRLRFAPRPEFDRKWLEVLTLKFQEGLTDKAIAERMAVSDRTVRNYWIRLQDVLAFMINP